MLAAEPRTTPAVLRRRTDETPTEPSPARSRSTRRHIAAMRRVTRPPPFVLADGESPRLTRTWHAPVVIAAIVISTFAAIIVLS